MCFNECISRKLVAAYKDSVENFFVENVGDDYDIFVDLDLALDEDNLKAAIASRTPSADYAFQCLIDYALH